MAVEQEQERQCLIKRWESSDPDCGTVEVVTCRQTGESLQDLKARHKARVAELMKVCPEE